MARGNPIIHFGLDPPDYLRGDLPSLRKFSSGFQSPDRDPGKANFFRLTRGRVESSLLELLPHDFIITLTFKEKGFLYI